jgi:hypothetical protein
MMAGHGTGGRKFLRIPSLCKRRGNPSSTTLRTTTAQDDQSSASHVENDYSDRQRAKARYKEAATLLEQSVKSHQGHRGFFDFGELVGEPEDFDDSQFRNKINVVLASRETLIKDRKAWSKCRFTVECIFTALSPFAKNFLMIAKEGQSVQPYISVSVF